VNELHGDCGLPDRGRHSFDRAAPSVADNEHSGLTAFEQVRLAIERPPPALHVALQDIGAGDHESVLITSEPSLHPLRDWDPSDHDEEGICAHRTLPAGRFVGNHELLQPPPRSHL
jgi:hypothetical protein